MNVQVGHTAKSKTCPLYGREADDDAEDDLIDSPVRRPTKSRHELLQNLKAVPGVFLPYAKHSAPPM